MLTLPTNFETRLTATTNSGLDMSGVVVYELELDAGTLYRSSQAVTWDGNSYTRGVTKCSPIINTMGTRVPECRVTFSNVTFDLRSHLDPTDLITNRRMTIRLLVRNLSTGAFEAGSVVLFKGFMQAPRRWDQKSLEVTVKGLASGALAMTPARVTTEWCNVHGYKDGVDCTTASAEATCDRTYTDCTARSNTHEFQGFQGIKNPELSRVFREHTAFWSRRARRQYDGPYVSEGYRLWEMTSDGTSEELSDHSRYIPVVLGRRLRDVSSSLVEEMSFQYTEGGTRTFIARVYVLGEGEISQVKAWYTEDTKGDERVEAALGADVGMKQFGSYWRPGTIGLDDSETETEYDATPATRKRAQNRDFYSVAKDPLSRTAYLTLIQETTDDNDNDKIPSPSADCDWLEIQKYTAASSPTTDGALAYTNNPIWEAVALYLNTRAGAGRWLTSADFDFTVTQPAALVCDSERTGFLATVTAISTGTTYTVDSTQDFQRGMTVEVDDGTPTDHVCSQILTDKTIKLDAAVTVAVNDILTAKMPRYSCHLALDRPEKTSAAVAKVLSHCNGYVTADVSGRIQLRVEATGSSVATFKDTGYADGYGIIEDSFEVLSPNEGRYKSVTNRIFARFTDQDNETDDVHASDHTNIASYGVVAEEIDYDGCDNAHTARQLATTQLLLRRDRGNGARFTVGPVGCKIQCGDIVTVTHAVPDWTAQDKRVIRTEQIGLGSKSDMLVRITVEDYQSTPYADITGEQRVVADITYPTVTLAVDTAANGVIILTWTWTGGDAPIRGWGVFKSTATHGGDPSLADRIFSTPAIPASAGWGYLQRRFTYTALAAEFGETLYFLVRANLPPHAAVLSNEVTAVPVDADPTGTQFLPGVNTIYDPDFDQSDMWTTIDPTGATVSPEADALIVAAWSNPEKSHNENDADPATATADTGAPARGIDITFNVTTGSTTGYWRVKLKLDDKTTTSSGRLSAAYRDPTTGRSKNFVYLQGGTGGVEAWYESPIHTVLYENAHLYINVYNNDPSTGDVDAWCYEAEWHTTTSNYYSSVAGRQGSLKGYPAGPNYGSIMRAWPNAFGDANAVIPDGSEWMVKLHARHNGTTPSHDLLVQLYDIDAAAYYTLMTIDKDDLATALQGFAFQWTAPAEYTGPFNIGVRSLGDQDMNVDKIQFYLGDTILGFALNRDDVGKIIDYETGKEDGYTRGAWDGTTVKISTIST